MVQRKATTREKKIRGRKRHLLVDTQGFPLALRVSGADCSDKEGARALLSSLPTPLPRLQRIWADSNYGGTLIEWVQQHLNCTLEIVACSKPFNPLDALPKKKGRPTVAEREARAQYLAQFSPEQLHPDTSTYQVAAHRWVIERTFGWITRSRRLARDYEGSVESSEAFLLVASSRLMLRRLVPPFP